MANKQKKTSELYEQTFNAILDSMPKDATKVTKDLKQDETLDDKRIELKTREKVYTHLTEDFEFNYKETHRQKRRLKETFFWFIMPLYAIIILGSMFAIIYSLFLDGYQIEIVLGAVASIIVSVIAIPTIIAKYLFPTGEDKDMTTMVNKMQSYDNDMRRIENNKKDINEKDSKEIEKDNQ
ncbi:MAG: hypothetical protein IJZ29_02215 [Clostridia bacterium]|nr:hypothetical protein [Clostridia bacterium]